MEPCYWGLCDCPTIQPCTSHQGIHCGEWNSQQITDLTQVQDNSTLSTEADIAHFTRDEQELEQIITSLQARKNSLEREKQEIEDQFRQAGSFSERRAVYRKIQNTNRSVEDIDADIDGLLDRLDAFENRWQRVTRVNGLMLIRPFSDASGYCGCYAEKRNRLAILDAKINDYVAEYQRNVQARNAMRSSITLRNVVTLVALPPYLAISLWIIFGVINVGLLAALLVVVVYALALITAILLLVRIQRRMVLLTRRILQFQLSYYQMQNIATCQQLSVDSASTFDHSWYYELITPFLEAEREE